MLYIKSPAAWPPRVLAQARCVLLLATLALLPGCAMFAHAPPANQHNICEVLDQHPKWYDYAVRSEKKWGTPVATQFAFVQRESSFRSHVRPDRTKLLGFIPWKRPSSAFGYAQAQDPVWGEYKADAAGAFARRSHMKHALDFIGWYNHGTQRQVGVSLHNPEHLYLAYHEGRGGYRRGSWRQKPQVQRAARQVRDRSAAYRQQLDGCEDRFRCRRFWQVWPFCR